MIFGNHTKIFICEKSNTDAKNETSKVSFLVYLLLKCLGIRIDSQFNVDNADKYGRNVHKDSPCRCISIICPSHSRTGGNHDYLNKTMNSNAAKIYFGSLNKTFRNEEIIAIDLR